MLQQDRHLLKGKMFSPKSCKEGQQSRRENWEMLCLALGRSSLHFGELKRGGVCRIEMRWIGGFVLEKPMKLH